MNTHEEEDHLGIVIEHVHKVHYIDGKNDVTSKL